MGQASRKRPGQQDRRVIARVQIEVPNADLENLRVLAQALMADGPAADDLRWQIEMILGGEAPLHLEGHALMHLGRITRH
jgi:hypothetical protein